MAAEAAASEFAPAKVNLFLHVRGQREDGYHLLESLVVFPEVGDLLQARPAETLSLSIEGPEAGALSDTSDNLVLRAARGLGGPGAHLTLVKSLPVAAGIGGGSSDAAAAIRVLSRIWGRPVPDGLALSLGADVPVCLSPQTRMMAGIGEQLSPGPAHPGFWMVLVNPRIAVPTGAVFSALPVKNNPPGLPAPAVGCDSFDTLVAWLSAQRNDLQLPAIGLCPVIGDVLAALSPAPLARMSGSGATCFGLLPDASSARALAATLERNQPDWWVAAAPVSVNTLR